MIRRFLTMGSVPQLRSEPGKSNKEEIELLLPVDIFWEAKEIVRLIHYSTSGDMRASQFWGTLAHLVKPYIVREADRIWFCKNVGAS